ncbi:DUF3492 domain-containing protein [Streptomyces smyrnaeus]|uniref:DUF3492 domain-containing protein n=1 Tax=Streptomyces smyrnaeus TaxID=1387713 RepID=UPI0033E668A4
MRIALLTEGGYPYVRGESALWCDRLLRGLDGHEFALFALSRSARQEEAGWCALPPNVARVRTAPLWGPGPATGGVRGLACGSYGRRDKRRFREHFTALAEAVCRTETDADPSTGQADRFAAGLYGLAELAAERGGLATALRSESAVRILESVCRAPGALPAAHAAQVPDLLAVVERLERALRPLSLDWYGQRGQEPGLSAADLCHAVGAGPAALPGLLAKRAYGVPLLITEYGVRLREHYLTSAAGAVARGVAGAPVRALLASFQRRLAREAYAQAQLITPGNSHARRWQERCGADTERLRTVYPGMDAAPFETVGEQTTLLPPTDGARPPARPTLVWVGAGGPAKDLGTLLHAFAQVRAVVPEARLRIVETGGASGRTEPSVSPPGGGASRGRPGTPHGPAAHDGAAERDGAYTAHCRALAARLFPHGSADGAEPVAFEELGGPAVPTLADAYALGGVVVLSSVVEGFPVSLVEAMFCGRATVSTDVGAAPEVVGGTGLLVPPRDPGALADACTALLRDPARAARLGAAARARALELFTVRQNIEAFRGIYLELMSRHPVGRECAPAEDARPKDQVHPFAHPAESHLPGRWAAAAARPSGSAVSSGLVSGASSSAVNGAESGAPGSAANSPEGRRPGSRPARRPSGTRTTKGSSAYVPSWARPDRTAREGAASQRPAVERAAVGAEPGEATAP